MADFGLWFRRFFGRERTTLSTKISPAQVRQAAAESFADRNNDFVPESFADSNNDFVPESFADSNNDFATESFADSNNGFALAMYEQLRDRPGNVFFCPLSVHIVLAMAQAGARGETATQMTQVLRTSPWNASEHSTLAKTIERLDRGGGGQYEMAVANSLWVQDGAPLKGEFADVIARYYGGRLSVVDFEGAADKARLLINQWVEDKTKQKILDAIPSGGLSAQTRLVLVNAVFFKGRWVIPFRKAATRDEPFFLLTGGFVRVPLMNRRQRVRYLKARNYQAVELAYQGNELSMLVLLPDRRDGLPALEKKISGQMLRDCVTAMTPHEIDLFLPRFKLTWGSVNLCNQLAALGMTRAFSMTEADFSGINDVQPAHEGAIFISSVYHKAFVEVNEAGTEAAAATAGLMYVLAKMPNQVESVPEFRVDHPFVFAIRDRISGALVFLGRIEDPTERGE